MIVLMFQIWPLSLLEEQGDFKDNSGDSLENQVFQRHRTVEPNAVDFPGFIWFCQKRG
jgi:hypothetical protein